jgi:low affinity Fe/Cu permease
MPRPSSFGRFAKAAARLSGRPAAFGLAVAVVVAFRSTAGAHNTLLDLEELEEDELDKIRDNYELLAKRARERRRAGSGDTDVEDVSVKPGED